MAETSDRHGELIHSAMGVYIPAVRQYVVGHLDDALGRDWYEAWLKERIDGGFLPDHVRDRYVDNLEAVQRGDRDPRDALGPSEFPYVLGDRREHFPPDLAPLIDMMHEVLRDRTIQPDLSDADAQQQAQRLLENCRAVLQPINEGAAHRIQTLLDTGDPNSVRDDADAPRRTRRPATRRAASERRHRPDSDDAQPHTASEASSARVADSSGVMSPPVADAKSALRAIIDIFRNEMREHISGAFQKKDIYDWLVSRVAEQAREDDPKTADRMIREYRKEGVLPDKIIDTGNFDHIISDNADVSRVFFGTQRASAGSARFETRVMNFTGTTRRPLIPPMSRIWQTTAPSSCAHAVERRQRTRSSEFRDLAWAHCDLALRLRQLKSPTVRCPRPRGQRRSRLKSPTIRHPHPRGHQRKMTSNWTNCAKRIWRRIAGAWGGS